MGGGAPASTTSGTPPASIAGGGIAAPYAATSAAVWVALGATELLGTVSFDVLSVGVHAADASTDASSATRACRASGMGGADVRADVRQKGQWVSAARTRRRQPAQGSSMTHARIRNGVTERLCATHVRPHAR